MARPQSSAVSRPGRTSAVARASSVRLVAGEVQLAAVQVDRAAGRATEADGARSGRLQTGP